MGVELKEQLRAIAAVLEGGHAGISDRFIDALNRARRGSKNEKASRVISRRAYATMRNR
jgi:hypothetical protein